MHDECLRAWILERISQLDPAAWRGALVAVRDLRRSPALVGVSRDAFDQAVLELGRQGRVALHRHDWPQSLTPEERYELVTDGQGTYYIGIALRQG